MRTSRQHRRTVRLARSAIASLATLAVLASTAAFIAVDRGNQARREARLALSRQLAAEATAAADDQLDRAQLLAAQAYATRPTAQTKSGLLQVLLRSAHLVGYLPGTAGTTQLVFEPRAGVLAVGHEDGDVALWDALARRKLHGLSPAHGAAVTAVAFGGDGRRLVSGAADGTVSVWDTSTGRRLDSRDVGGRILEVTVDAGGRRAAATSEDAAVVWDTATGQRLHRLRSTFGTYLRFVDAEALVVADPMGRIQRWDLGATPPRTTERIVGGGQPLESAYSADLRLFSAVTLGQKRPYLVDVSSGQFLPEPRGPTVAVDAMGFSGDGRILATAGDGRVVLWDTRTREALPEVLAGIPGQPPPSGGQSLALAVSHNGRRVAAAGERGVAVWDLGAHVLLRELRASGAQPLSNVPNVVRGTSSAAFSPDGQLLAWSTVPSTDVGTDFGGQVVVWDLTREREILRFPSLQVVGFSPDGQRVAGASSYEDPFVVADLRTGERKEVRTLPWKAEQQRASAPPNGQLWSVTSASGLGASVASDRWWQLWASSPRRSPKGMETTESHLRCHLRPYFGCRQLRQITPSIVLRWQNEAVWEVCHVRPQCSGSRSR